MITGLSLQDNRMLGLECGHQLAMHVAERLDQDVDLAAAGEPDSPGQVVANAIVKKLRRGSLQDGLSLLEDFTFQAAATDRTGNLATGADRHPGARRPRRTTPRADHRGQSNPIARREPGPDVSENVPHRPKSSPPILDGFPSGGPRVRRDHL